MDKVAKTQNAMRDGFAVQQQIQGAQLQQKMEARIQSVNETENTGDGTEKVKDKGAKGHGGGAGSGEGKKKESRQETPAQENVTVISDTSLGRTIDISL